MQDCSNSIANALELLCSNSIANALELLQSCTKPLIIIRVISTMAPVKPAAMNALMSITLEHGWHYYSTSIVINLWSNLHLSIQNHKISVDLPLVVFIAPPPPCTNQLCSYGCSSVIDTGPSIAAGLTLSLAPTLLLTTKYSQSYHPEITKFQWCFYASFS